MVLLIRGLLLAAAAAAMAQDLRPNLPPIPTYEVHRAAAPISIDGVLDEVAWKQAPIIHYVFPWDKQTGAKQNTAARLLWDEKFLYIVWEAEDADIVARHASADDPTYLDDAVEIFINPDPRQTWYYGLEINARAVIYDYFYVFPKMLLKRINFEGVHIASFIRGTLNVRGDTDKGWIIELGIPWRNFAELSTGAPPKPGDSWTANLNRWDGVQPDRRLSQWSDSGLLEPNPHNPARFGRLVFVE